jgi:hypothetical protein
MKGDAVAPVTRAPADPPAGDKRCADRVGVERDLQHVPATLVRAWIDHLRSHGWADKDLDPVWIVRGRQGVTRWDDSVPRRASPPAPSQ